MTARALLLDDDPWVLALLRARLGARLPDLAVDARVAPALDDARDDHAVFVVDDEFGGRAVALELVTRIRARAPRAFVALLSARADARTLRRLMSLGLDLACDKAEPADVDRLVEAVAAHVERGRPAPAPGGLVAAARALVDAWRRRLEACEAEEGAA